MIEPDATDAETSELRGSLRDLFGLLALPASWRGREPADILNSFSEALDATVDVDVLFASIPWIENAVDVVRMRSTDGDGVRARDVRGWFGAFAGSTSSSVARLRCGKLGELSTVFEPIGYYASLGSVIVASGRPGFPSPRELSVIRAATALVTTSLETARALHEREEGLRAREDFMAILGHELRNPLSPITTALAIMRERSGGQLSHEEQVIERQVEHLGRLVDDLLDVARVTRGTIELKRSRVEISGVVEQAVEACASLFESKRHTLRLDVPRTGIVVDGDRARLVQIMANLLTNAARYTPEAGNIAVSATAAAGLVSIVVRDDGIGMTPDLLARVFDPFVQGRHASDAQYGGLGIGLALVRKLVMLHGGQVVVRSEGLGFGSSFEITLPLTANAGIDAAPQVSRGALPRGRGRRILVVDDNVDSGEMLGEALTMVGHDVRVLHDPFAAVGAAADLDADVVVLDLGMPGRDGFAVAGDILDRFGDRAPSLIALTGYGQASDRAKTAAAGFDAHFVKPVDLVQLITHIGALAAP